MVKTTFIALTLMTVITSFLATPAIADENNELAIITADRDHLRNRLSKAIAYSKARGKKLEEAEMQLARSMEERKVLAKRLSRAIAVSKERGKKLANSNASRKQAEDRLRRVIAISKERGEQLANSNANRKQTEDRLRRAIAISKERGKQLTDINTRHSQTRARLKRVIATSKERRLKLADANSNLKQTEDRLQRVVTISKKMGRNLTKSNASLKQSEERVQRVIGVSKSMKKHLQGQIAKSKESQSSDWVAQAGVSLRASIGGLEGTEIIENYDNNTVKVQLGNKGLFRRAGSSLSNGGKALLSAIAPQLLSQNASFTVIGHTDSTPVGQGGKYGDNEALSLARSLSALQFLRDQGIPKQQLSAAGHGADSPIASNDTAEGRQQNRRVEIVLRAN